MMGLESYGVERRWLTESKFLFHLCYWICNKEVVKLHWVSGSPWSEGSIVCRNYACALHRMGLMSMKHLTQPEVQITYPLQHVLLFLKCLYWIRLGRKIFKTVDWLGQSTILIDQENYSEDTWYKCVIPASWKTEEGESYIQCLQCAVMWVQDQQRQQYTVVSK